MPQKNYNTWLLTLGVSDGVVCKCNCRDCVTRVWLTLSVSGGVVCKCSCKDHLVRLLLTLRLKDVSAARKNVSRSCS
jgi:hypothetical protein